MKDIDDIAGFMLLCFSVYMVTGSFVNLKNLLGDVPKNNPEKYTQTGEEDSDQEEVEQPEQEDSDQEEVEHEEMEGSFILPEPIIIKKNYFGIF
jgi:hypothetical protein